MNKRGSEKVNAVAYILYLVIIAGGVTILISSYVNTPVDVHSAEAQILYDRMMNCFAKGGFLNQNLLNPDFDAFSNCSVDKTVLKNSNIYFKFSFLNETGGEIRNSLVGGDLNELKSKQNDCEVFMNTKTKNAIACIFRNETYLYINSTVKNVKIVGWVASKNEGVRSVSLS